MKKFDTLFLDRDGVLNRKIDNGYVLTIEQIDMLPGVREFLVLARSFFEHIVVVSNQRCVGRGLLAFADLELINAEINRFTGNLIDRFYVCPHLDEDNCDCRKPKKGLFLRGLRDYGINFENSWMIGDSESDMIPAKQLGITTFFISNHVSTYADFVINEILQAEPFLTTLPVNP